MSKCLRIHDWRDTGFWLDSWTTRKQCAICGTIYDAEPRTEVQSAMFQRERDKQKADDHYRKMTDHPELCGRLIKADRR